MVAGAIISNGRWIFNAESQARAITQACNGGLTEFKAHKMYGRGFIFRAAIQVFIGKGKTFFKSGNYS